MINKLFKVALGIALGVVGIIMFMQADGSQTANRVQAQTGTNYEADWQAEQVLAIRTDNLPIEYSNTSSRKWMAIGPSAWSVKFYTGSGGSRSLAATETWTAPDFHCYEAANPCKNGGANAGTYLFGIASEHKMASYKAMTVASMPWNDDRIWNTTSVNPRFQGPGAVGQTNQSDNIEGFYSPGAYGWFAGKVTENTARDNIMAVGMMIPLQWKVVGTLQ